MGKREDGVTACEIFKWGVGGVVHTCAKNSCDMPWFFSLCSVDLSISRKAPSKRLSPSSDTVTWPGNSRGGFVKGTGRRLVLYICVTLRVSNLVTHRERERERNYYLRSDCLTTCSRTSRPSRHRGSADETNRDTMVSQRGMFFCFLMVARLTTGMRYRNNRNTTLWYCFCSIGEGGGGEERVLCCSQAESEKYVDTYQIQAARIKTWTHIRYIWGRRLRRKVCTDLGKNVP